MSNTVTATVSIRKLGALDLWGYEISQGHAPTRGTLRWQPKDSDHPEYLYLVLKVIGDYYADLSKQGIWQETTPIEQL